MKILALDTSTQVLCIALSDGSRTFLTRLDLGTRLSGMLVETLRQQLDAAGWKAGDIDCFACGVGPGSFTALRIGMAAVKALAWAVDRPVVGVGSLDILAYTLRAEEGMIVPVMDAKRSMVYTAAYTSAAGRIRRRSPYRLVPVDDFARAFSRKIYPREKNRIIIMGDGIPLVRDKLCGRMSDAFLADKDFWYPYPQALLELAQQARDRGQTTDAFRVQPVYLYPKECQIRK
ncbi:MAG TPA: tRNA (adenosine(37)-N6)-threonylcarbamoyltransferase complex dimerization subunit type 1 TsaB [Candidatus Omnitrophota bacterium]|nr:tRNA (adenosine(37)-N6)-threonylcarbamoyltransferase complex dimerization subunit type 1 TsaB [Candidatus Omnitrophota bacterium]